MTIRGSQRGFSVVLVLALIVVLGSVLAYTVTSADVLGHALARRAAVARMEQAAQTGLEWARLRVRSGATCAATTNLALPFTSGAVTVTVRCTLTGTHTEGAVTVRTFRLDATACQPATGTCPNVAGGGDYVERVAGGNAER